MQQNWHCRSRVQRTRLMGSQRHGPSGYAVDDRGVLTLDMDASVNENAVHMIRTPPRRAAMPLSLWSVQRGGFAHQSHVK